MFNFNPSEPKALKKFWTREIRRFLLLDAWFFVLFFTILVIFYSIEIFFGYGESIEIIEESNELFNKQLISPDLIETNALNLHIYPLYPFFLKFCTFFCFGSKWISLPLSSFILTLLATLSFYYFLNTYKKIEHIRDSMFLSFIFPFVFQIQRYTLNEETLFFIEICHFFSFIYKKQYKKALIICFASIFTKFEGFLLLFVFIIIMIKSKQTKLITYSFLSLLSPLLLSFYHHIKYNDAFLVFKCIKLSYNLIPFVSLWKFINESTVYFFSVFILTFIIPLITSAFLLWKESFPLSLFSIITIINFLFINDTNYEYRMGSILTFLNSISFIQGYEKNQYIKFKVELVIAIKLIIICIMPTFINHYFVGFDKLKNVI